VHELGCQLSLEAGIGPLLAPLSPCEEHAIAQLVTPAPAGGVQEANLEGGGYVSTGKAHRDWVRNWGRRWMVEGVGSGWWLELGG
jgi:hypothetical protein